MDRPHARPRRHHRLGVCRRHPTAYIDITLHSDVWFLFLTESGGLVCFVTVGGVYVYAVECMTMCVAGRLVGRVIPPTI